MGCFQQSQFVFPQGMFLILLMAHGFRWGEVLVNGFKTLVSSWLYPIEIG